jgi:hypothetical protein
MRVGSCRGAKGMLGSLATMAHSAEDEHGGDALPDEASAQGATETALHVLACARKEAANLRLPEG